MSLHKAEAIVLKRHDFRETSLIVTFYCREFGKLSGILKGIRQEPFKFASSVEPFSHNEIIFYKKRSSALHLVSQCELKGNFDGIRRSVYKAGSASIIIELLDAVMAQEDANNEVFDLALDSLRLLEAGNDSDKIITIFKIKLLNLSGFKPNFDSCVSCSLKISGESRFSLNLGGLICLPCHRKDLKARPIFRGTIASVLYIENNSPQNNLKLGMNPQIKKELDMVLNSFINFHIGKGLNAQKVLAGLSLVSRYRDSRRPSCSSLSGPGPKTSPPRAISRGVLKGGMR